MADSPNHPVLVLVDRWEYECCGEPLRVGDTRTLHLVPLPPDRVWSRRLPVPPEWGATHHMVERAERTVTAQVFRLWEAFADLESAPGGWRPAPSSGSLRPVLTMQPRRDSWEGEPEFKRPGLPKGRRRPRAALGWVVLLDVLAEVGADECQTPGWPPLEATAQ